jgi:hypothetical protein
MPEESSEDMSSDSVEKTQAVVMVIDLTHSDSGSEGQ